MTWTPRISFGTGTWPVARLARHGFAFASRPAAAWLAAAADRARAERDSGHEREQDRARDRPPPPNLAAAALPPTLARAPGGVVLVQRHSI